MKHLLILTAIWPLLSFPVTAAPDVVVTVSDKTMTAMKSPWADYFGTHYASSPDEAGKTWNTVRSYGGTHVGIQGENSAAPPRKGLFTGREVRFTPSARPDFSPAEFTHPSS